jgi:hypothetical protein
MFIFKNLMLGYSAMNINQRNFYKYFCGMCLEVLKYVFEIYV